MIVEHYYSVARESSGKPMGGGPLRVLWEQFVEQEQNVNTRIFEKWLSDLPHHSNRTFPGQAPRSNDS